eukprot:scaffold1893_cov220-Amphora_coffeaeformis.AAC.23
MQGQRCAPMTKRAVDGVGYSQLALIVPHMSGISTVPYQHSYQIPSGGIAWILAYFCMAKASRNYDRWA